MDDLDPENTREKLRCRVCGKGTTKKCGNVMNGIEC
jgi:hypothetical protein